MSIDTNYNFHQRHHLSADVTLAGESIISIGAQLVQYGVGFSVSKVNHWSFDGYNNVFVELFCTDLARSKLLTLLFDPNTKKLHEVPDRKSGEKNKENERSLEWILEFCKKHSESDAIDVFSRIISQIQKKSGDYYVYRHLFSDGRMYIGKGTRSRYRVKKGRGYYYDKTLDEVGEPEIQKLCSGLSEEIAYKIESEILKELREHYNYSFVINKTDGMEKEKNIGDIPFRTLRAMHRNQNIKIEDPIFLQAVNIFQRTRPDVGSSKLYYRSIDIFSAAMRLGCTLNEVVRAKEISGVVINGFTIMSDDEIDRAIAEP